MILISNRSKFWYAFVLCVCGQRRARRACACAQAYVSLRCSTMRQIPTAHELMRLRILKVFSRSEYEEVLCVLSGLSASPCCCVVVVVVVAVVHVRVFIFVSNVYENLWTSSVSGRI